MGGGGCVQRDSGGSSQALGDRKLQKRGVNAQNLEDFPYRALIRWNKERGISGERQHIMKTGATPRGLTKGQALKGPLEASV